MGVSGVSLSSVAVTSRAGRVCVRRGGGGGGGGSQCTVHMCAVCGTRV